MIDVQQILQRQTQWQASRRTLSWPEKIRMAQSIRDSVLTLRTSREKHPDGRPDSHLRHRTGHVR